VCPGIIDGFFRPGAVGMLHDDPGGEFFRKSLFHFRIFHTGDFPGQGEDFLILQDPLLEEMGIFHIPQNSQGGHERKAVLGGHDGFGLINQMLGHGDFWPPTDIFWIFAGRIFPSALRVFRASTVEWNRRQQA